MSEEAITILKEINNKLNFLQKNDEELNFYDIRKIKEITGIGENTIYGFFTDKEKYPTFPRIQSW